MALNALNSNNLEQLALKGLTLPLSISTFRCFLGVFLLYSLSMLCLCCPPSDCKLLWFSLIAGIVCLTYSCICHRCCCCGKCWRYNSYVFFIIKSCSTVVQHAASTTMAVHLPFRKEGILFSCHVGAMCVKLLISQRPQPHMYYWPYS